MVQMTMITNVDPVYCGYNVCGRSHWTKVGLFSRPVKGPGWSESKVFCDVICYAKDLVMEETGRVCEVVFNG
tara:strand:+ start:1271 stop:1486 length:216 start_codon:yes stop_codon:yes gene_type:complete